MSNKKMSCAAEVEFLSEDYFETCRVNEKPITFAGLARAMGFSRSDSLVAYRSKVGYEEFHEAMGIACLTVEQFYEEQLFNKGVNVSGPIFGLKARVGLTDKDKNDQGNVTIVIKGNAAKL
jgi:hypothetical protein